MERKANKALGVTFNGNVTFQGPMFDIHDNQHVEIINQGLQDKASASVDNHDEPVAGVQTNPTPLPPPKGHGFTERLDAIIRKASEHNNSVINAKLRGFERPYTYYINYDCFSKALKVLQEKHSDKLSAYLKGNLDSTEVTKVCYFIGHVLKMKIINDQSLLIKDILFAFEEYYPSKLTIMGKLSENDSTPELDALMKTFQPLLKSFLC